jgi:hypothetical protein
MTATRIPALVTTPAANSHCDDCERLADALVTGIRYPGDRATFPHCPSCGSTDLRDDRSPWEIAHEARVNAMAAEGVLRWDRLDVADRVLRVAVASTCACGDCQDWRRRFAAARFPAIR